MYRSQRVSGPLSLILGKCLKAGVVDNPIKAGGMFGPLDLHRTGIYSLTPVK